MCSLSMVSLVSLDLVVYHTHLYKRIQGHLEVQEVLVNLHLHLDLVSHQNQDHHENLFKNAGKVFY